MPLDNLDGKLGSLKRRVNAGVYLSRCVVPVCWVLVTFGLAWLFCRMLVPAYAGWSFVILGAVPVVLLYCWRACRRDGAFFEGMELVELADHLSAADGLACSAAELGWTGAPRGDASPGIWNRIVSRMDLGAVRLDWSWFGWRLVPVLLFCVAVLFVPPRQVGGGVGKSGDIMVAFTQPLAERIRMSAEVLPPEERERLEEQLEEIEGASEGVSRERWEAIEDMERRLEEALAQSEASAYQLSSSLEELASMVSQQEVKAPNVDSAQLQSEIDAAAAAISEELSKNRMAMDEDLKKRLQGQMGECQGGKGNSGELGELLKDIQGLGQKLKEMQEQGEGQGQTAGRGGRDRGRGDASLVFGQERAIDARFEEQQLENQYFAPSDLMDVGITPVAPKGEAGEFTGTAVRDFGNVEGSNVSRIEISPGQRGVVSRYFE